MTKLSNSQRIQKLLEAGFPVQVDIEEQHESITFYDTTSRDLFVSNVGLWKESDVNQIKADSIKSIPRKPPVYPVGTRVKVLDIVKECGTYAKWTKEHKSIKTGVISHVVDSSEGIFYELKELSDMNYTCWFPHYCIVPHFEEEEKMVELHTMASAGIAKKNKEVDYIDYIYRFPISEVKAALEKAERGTE